jgi:hypothetical protein
MWAGMVLVVAGVLLVELGSRPAPAKSPDDTVR